MSLSMTTAASAPVLPPAKPLVAPKLLRQAPALWVPRVDSLGEFGLMISRQLTQCRRFGGQLAVLWLEAAAPQHEDTPWTDATRHALMQALGRRLRSRVRGTDLVLQVGETSFAVLLLEAGQREAQIVHERLRTALDSAYGVGDELMTLDLQMGTATFPEGGHRGADLAESARQNLRRKA